MTATWTPTQSPTSTRTPTVRPTSTPTLLPTVTPSPTPECTTLGVTLWMPSDLYRPGSICSCSVAVCNPTTISYEDVPLFVILDYFGNLFFAPSYSSFDSYTIYLPAQDLLEIEILPEFIWPDGNFGNVSGVVWYAAMTDPDITELFGEMDFWYFGWMR